VNIAALTGAHLGGRKSPDSKSGSEETKPAEAGSGFGVAGF